MKCRQVHSQCIYDLLPGVDLHRTEPVSSQSWTGEKSMGSYPAQLNYVQLMDPGVGAIINFHCEPTEEHIRL